MTDQFGLWLQNRQLVRKIDDISLTLKQSEIIKLFGFRRILKQLLKHHHDLNWIEHNKLSQILYRKEKILDNINSNHNSPAESDSDNDINSIASIDSKTHTITLTLLPTNIISYINRFLCLVDMAKNQSICTTFCIINRMTSSYSNPKYDLRQIGIIPHLPQYIEWTLSDTIQTKLKGVKSMKQAVLYDIKAIERTGIIPFILKSININNKTKLNEELQLEIMSFIQILYDNRESCHIIMTNGAAEILANALRMILIDWEKSDIDYTCKMMKYITRISYKITRHDIKFRDIFIQTSILNVIVNNYESLILCCKMELISFIRILFHGNPQPDWNLIHAEIKNVILMINILIKESKSNNEWFVELLYILCDITRYDKYIEFIIEYNSLEILCDVLCKLVYNTGVNSIYKPFILLINQLITQHNIEYMFDITDCLLKLVTFSYDNNINTSYKSYKKTVENRRCFLADYDICDVIVKMLQFCFQKYLIITTNQNEIYLDIMNNCVEIMYYITKTEQELGISIPDFTHILIKIFDNIHDDELKCDILWIFQNFSAHKQSIRYVISSSIMDCALNILKIEQNNPSNYDENELKKNMVSACLLIYENIACGTSTQFALIWSSDFLDLNFNIFLNSDDPDDKIQRNTIYCLKAITNSLYFQCKKYYKQETNFKFLQKDKELYSEMIQFTVVHLCKLLQYVKDWAVIENILWVLSFAVINKYWAKIVVSSAMNKIIEFLKFFTSNSEILESKKSVIKNVMRGSFIITRRIANHSEKLAKEIVRLKFFDINLNKYLLYQDGLTITNVLQAIKSLFKVIGDIDIYSKNILFDVNKGIVSALISILYFDDEFDLFINSSHDYDQNIQIRIESTLDILEVLLTYNDDMMDKCYNFNIAKSIAEAGGLDQLEKIRSCKRVFVANKANNVREMIVSKFIAFVLQPNVAVPKATVL